MKILICFVFLLVELSQAIAGLASPCNSGREFITTYRFLESKTTLKLTKDQRIDLAKGVAKSCSGSADRFVRVSELLIKAGVNVGTALEVAKKKAQLGPGVVNAFMIIFREAFLEKYLDMNLSNALKLADSVEEMKDIKPELIREYFRSLIEFCIEDNPLKLTKRSCAQFTAKALPIVADYPLGLKKEFADLSNYLVDLKSLETDKEKLLEVLITVLKSGPGATQSFIQSHRFAKDDGGLKLDEAQALNFALELGQYQSLEIPTER